MAKKDKPKSGKPTKPRKPTAPGERTGVNRSARGITAGKFTKGRGVASSRTGRYMTSNASPSLPDAVTGSHKTTITAKVETDIARLLRLTGALQLARMSEQVREIAELASLPGLRHFVTTNTVSHSALRSQQRAIFEALDEVRVLGVSKREEIDGVLLSPEAFSELSDRAHAGDRLRELLPLLLAAARDGVAVPSEALEALGVTATEGEFDWRALNELLAAFPVEITHGEDGELLPAPAGRVLRHEPVGEIDDELILR